MTTTLSPVPKQFFLDNNGKPLVGGKLFTYAAGTTTKLATYTDSSGGTPNSNPIILDFRGEANVWIPPNVAYKYALARSTDTDPPGNPIWTVDHIVSAQLLTLYGGVDTGSTNAYILNFTANFSAYADGIVIYWIPANTNTGASTINVNGLGPIAIVNYGGDPVNANQIIAGSITGIMYVSGEFIIFTSPLAVNAYTGSFSPVWFGLTANPAGAMYYQVVGDQVTLQWSGARGTSNATGLSILNLPINLRPASRSDYSAGGTLPTMIVDNGVVDYGCLRFTSGGEIIFSTDDPPSETGFTNSGDKGLDDGWTITYLIR